MSCVPVEVVSSDAPSASSFSFALPLHYSDRMWRCSIAAIGLWTILVAALLSTYIQPSLRIHDEFSYRLAADTLLNGRFANPTPPAWQALQSFHIIMQPAYASKYPIGTAIVTAIGWAIAGTPHAGSWLAAGMLACAITWMLAGVLPRRWALIGGLLLSLHPFVQLAWGQSLLHGSLAATGCALLTGGALRLRRRVSFRAAFISGCGIGLLAVSRPFEGLCSTLICAAMLWCAWNRFAFKQRVAMTIRAACFAAAPIAFTLLLIIAQNVASTGNWKQMAYQLHEHQYAVAPVFVFSDPIVANIAPRDDVPAMFQKFHAIDSLSWYAARAGWRGWFRGLQDSLGVLFSLSFPFVLTLLFSGSRWLKFQVPRATCVAIALQVAASSCVTWVYAHYLAVLLPWLLLVSLVALRQAMRSRSTTIRKQLHFVLPAIAVIQVACLCVFAGFAKEIEAGSWAHRRQAIVDELQAIGGKHLILVRYSDQHNVHQEWVYNDADPVNSRIVWARNEDGRWIDEVLQAYEGGRSVWELQPDVSPVTLQPYKSLHREETSN